MKVPFLFLFMYRSRVLNCRIRIHFTARAVDAGAPELDDNFPNLTFVGIEESIIVYSEGELCERTTTLRYTHP